MLGNLLETSIQWYTTLNLNRETFLQIMEILFPRKFYKVETESSM